MKGPENEKSKKNQLKSNFDPEKSTEIFENEKYFYFINR